MIKKIVSIIFGLSMVALAAIGVALPGIPTTPFLILAFWAFASSSKRLHKWLSNAPLFSKAMVHVDHWNDHKAVTKNVKIVSQSFAWGSVITTAIFGSLFVAGFVALAAVACSISMWVIPTKPLKKK